MKNTETSGRNNPWEWIPGRDKIQSILGPNTLPDGQELLFYYAGKERNCKRNQVQCGDKACHLYFYFTRIFSKRTLNSEKSVTAA